jgi:glycosyltransferase involved in cell wall biosynthesis
VVTEGLMFSNVCLCSSAIGHAQLLESGKEGLLFTTESAEDLADKMAWLLQNPAELATLGAAGRRLYEKYFLMSSFANNVENLLQHNR